MKEKENEQLGVFPSLVNGGVAVFLTYDLEEAIKRAQREFLSTGTRVWVLNSKHDIYAYVDKEGTERF